MRRNTTPTIEVKTNVNLSIFTTLKLYLRQDSYLVVKTITGASGSTLSAELTEEETKGLKPFAPARLQLRGVTTTGKKLASDIWYTDKIGDVLDDTLIGG